jgi:DtxR family Mn-dependent transcriptional regulator
VSQLAEYLRHLPVEEGIGTTLASVSGMVHRMSKEGLLAVNKGKQVELTPAGELLAHDVVRRHRLSERLLVDVLGVPLEQAETEAHRLEHSISAGLLRQIEKKLGYPETCPYGRPIDREGEVGPRPEPVDILRLNRAENGRDYEVVCIPDEDFPLLRFMVNSSILPKQRIRVGEMASYRGVVDLELDGAKVAIGIDVAARIRIRPVEASHPELVEGRA